MPPGTAATAQVFEHRIDGAPHMEQHRKIVVARDPQLGAEIELLPRLVARFDKTVEPDFADRQRLLALHGFAQGVEVLVAGAVDIHRMNAVGGTAARMFTADRGHCAEIGAFHRGHHDQTDTRLNRGRAATASRSSSNSAASRWQWVSTSTGYSRSSIQACCMASSFFSPQWLSFSSKPGKRHDPAHQVDKVEARRIDVGVASESWIAISRESVHFISSSVLP
jgi:hypothetical protein